MFPARMADTAPKPKPQVRARPGGTPAKTPYASVPATSQVATSSALRSSALSDLFCCRKIDDEQAALSLSPVFGRASLLPYTDLTPLACRTAVVFLSQELDLAGRPWQSIETYLLRTDYDITNHLPRPRGCRHWLEHRTLCYSPIASAAPVAEVMAFTTAGGHSQIDKTRTRHDSLLERTHEDCQQ